MEIFNKHLKWRIWRTFMVFLLCPNRFRCGSPSKKNKHGIQKSRDMKRKTGGKFKFNILFTLKLIFTLAFPTFRGVLMLFRTISNVIVNFSASRTYSDHSQSVRHGEKLRRWCSLALSHNESL